MAHYLVRAKPAGDLDALKTRLDSGDIQQLSPFGGEMHRALLRAKIAPDGTITWEEQCFCSPPLKQERTVLDQYFTDLTTETIQRDEGWQAIESLPSLWESGV